jgi:hypothetical protein
MIKGYNGVPVLAHPFTFKPKDSRHLLRDKAFMRRVDAVELFDCGYATERQMGVIAGTGKPLTAGTDSHTISSFNALTGAKADGIDSFLSGILKKRNIIYYRKPSHLSRLAHACTVFRKNLSVKRRS